MNKFIEYITIGKFKEAKECLVTLSQEQFYFFIIECGFDKGLLPLYTFVNFLLIENETAHLHRCAAVLIAQCFVHLEGAYSMGLFHARRAIELAPDEPTYKEYILLYYDIPDKLLSKEEAIEIATQLQQQDPGNIAADHFFQDIKGGIPDYLKK